MNSLPLLAFFLPSYSPSQFFICLCAVVAAWMQCFHAFSLVLLLTFVVALVLKLALALALKLELRSRLFLTLLSVCLSVCLSLSLTRFLNLLLASARLCFNATLFLSLSHSNLFSRLGLTLLLLTALVRCSYQCCRSRLLTLIQSKVQ